MRAGLKSVMVLCVAALALVAATVAMAHSPDGRIASTCGVGSGTGYGYTYLTTLTVKRTSCSYGKSFVKRHGKVKGWHCATKKLASSPIQVQDRETCNRGSEQIIWTYTQNT